MLRRQYTKGELHGLVSALGYTLKSSFTTAHPYLYNHTPYSRKMAQMGITQTNYGFYTELVHPDDTLTNNTGASRTISIASMIAGGDITDEDTADISHLYFDSTTLANLRGCGIGGNNHLCLHVSSDAKSITYTPRAGFYGKAQFGLNVTDGKEDGSYVVVTIEVYKGTNVTCARGANMVCNADFEEGSEIKLKYTAEAIPNSPLMENTNHENGWQGVVFSDSHPYCFNSDIYGYYMYASSGIVVQNSHYGLFQGTFPFYSTCGSADTSTAEAGNFFLSGPTPTGYRFTFDLPYPKDTIGSRYQEFAQPGASYYYLKDSAKHCNKYILEFDLYKTIIASDSVFPVKIGFTDRLVDLSTAIPDTTFYFSLTDTIHSTWDVWQHYSIPFNYCGSNPSNLLYFATLDPNVFAAFHIDNLSLRQDTTPVAPLLVSITPSVISGCTALLHATVSNAFCTPSYLWNATAGSVLTAASDTVTLNLPFTYTVHVSDGCRDTSASFTMTETNPVPIFGPPSVCVGSSVTLTDASSGGRWTSSNPSIATVGSASGVVTGVAAGVVTITYTTTCSSIMTVTVYPVPAAISGFPYACIGRTITLSDATPGGSWSVSDTTIATIGATTGIVTGIATGSATVSYTMPGGCYVTIPLNVNPTPPPLTPTSICVGATTTFTDTPPGGTWLSSTPSIANISSGTGVATGLSAGVDTITYLILSTTCFTSTTLTVNPVPASITGTLTVCTGATTTLSDGTTGGTWTSSSPAIATVGSSTGIVTGIAAGTATIYYTLGTGCQRSVTVTVNPLPASITGTMNICVGATTTLSDGTTGGHWSSSSTGIAIVGSSSGVVTGVSGGMATITYTISTGCYVTATVTVNPLPAAITGLFSICTGATTTLTDVTTGGTWSSSNATIVSIGSSSGIATGVAAGTVTITYRLPTGCFVTATLTDNPVPAAISGTSAICMGSTAVLTDGTTGGVWSSSNTAVATIGSSSGIVNGLATGTATISYTLSTGCYAISTITINAVPAAITGTVNVCVGSSTTLSDVTSGGVWSSSATGIATVGTGGVVTGVASGSATITYMLPTGCYATKAVTVYPVPVTISGASSLCAGATITLTDGTPGGVWMSSSPSIATVGSASGIVTGVSGGTATISYGFAAGCYASRVVTVYPTPAAISGPSGVCRGATITLTDATGGGSWSSSNPSVASVSAGVVTGAAAGTATITYAVGSCFATKAVTVNPIPGPITGITNLCRAISDTLFDTTAGGTWSSRSTAIATIGSSSGIVTWVHAGIDTITYGFPGSGCSVFTVIRAWDTACVPCNVFGDTFTVLGSSGIITGNYANHSYYIPNSVTITGNDTFTNAIVLIAPGDTVYIDTNAFLSLNNSHLFSLCSEWSGMMLKPGRTHSGRLYITGQSLIEDAMCAVYIPNAVTPASSTDYVFKSDAATFNRNVCGVYITHYNPAIAPYPFSIKNTVFTGRDLQTTNPHFPYQWPPTVGLGGFKSYWNPGDTFLAPYNINKPIDAGLGYPYRTIGTYSGLPTRYGIRLDSVGSNNNPATRSSGVMIPGQYYEITIGDTAYTDNNGNQNLFDNLMFGVFSINSNVTSVNNAFTNLFASNAASVGSTYPLGGDGIYAVTTDDIANENRLRVYTPAGAHYNNLFYDFNYGIETANMFQIIGQNCFMINKNFGTATSAPAGSGGFSIRTAKYDTLDISYNSITNVANGIAVWMLYDHTVRLSTGGTSFSYAPSQYMGLCNLNNNLIQPHPIWTASLTTQHVNVGISYQNAITHSAVSSDIISTVNNLNVDGNTIHDAYNGIYVNNYSALRRTPYTSFNTVHLRRYPTQRMQYGINETNSMNGRLSYNFVSGPYGAASLNDSMKAYYGAYNTSMDMGCNYDSLIGRGFEFFMTNTGTNWHDNKMYGNLKGFVLNGGVIGPQVNGGTTSSSNSMNNEWQGTWGGATGDSQTYVISASPSSSSFYIQSGVADMNPTVNGGLALLFRYSFGSSIFFATHSAGPCLPITSPPPADTGNLNDLIAKQHVDFVYNVVPNNWMAQFALWKAALLDSTVIDSSAIVAQFVHIADSVSRFKYITSIEAALDTGDLTTANYLLSLNIDSMANTARDSVTQVTVADDVSADYIVYNYQQFYTIYIDYVTGAMTADDSINILALAQLCPEQNGGVVFQARALYSSIFNDLSVFNDDSCIDVDTGYIAYRHSHNQQAGQDGMQHYRLFPNPNDGSFMLQQYMPDNNAAEVKIYDAVGRMVYSGSLQFTGGRASLNMGNYAPGLYLLEMKDDKNIIFRCKFVKQ